MKNKFLLLAASLLTVFTAASAELKIAENGKACAGILIPENAKPIVKMAAQELTDYLKKITGAEFKYGTVSDHKVNFKLGGGNPEGLDKEEFIIRTNGNDIEIYGHDTAGKVDIFMYYYYTSEKGTLMGVYHFLEQLGVRWPTPTFEHIPECKTLVVKDMNIKFKPYFSDRHVGSFAYSEPGIHPDGTQYFKSNKDAMMWFMRIGESPRHVVHGSHSERGLGLYRDKKWQADPKRLQLTKKGKRNRNYSCWTNPDVRKLWLDAADAFFSGKRPQAAGLNRVLGGGVLNGWPYPFICADEFMIDPMDNDGVNDGKCYCESCQDFRKKNPCADDTELIWSVIIEVAKFVEQKYPGKYISTLRYPPKRLVPQQKLPSNIRVRLCVSGPKSLLQGNDFKNDKATVKVWKGVTGNKVPLWTYHCVMHMDSMPHIVETYPHLIKKYVSEMKDFIAGMYMETHASTFTRKLLDMYIFHRLMKNPDIDVDKEIDEFCRITYGPAHKEAKAFYAKLEELFGVFWHRTVPATKKSSSVTPWKYGDKAMQKKLWTLAYTAEEVAKLEKLVSSMEKKTVNTKYAKQVMLLKKYIFETISSQRQIAMGKEEMRKKLIVSVPQIPASDNLPTAEQWAKSPENHLIPAVLFWDKLEAAGSFKLLADGKKMFVRAEMQEPLMNKTIVKAGQKNGSQSIWKDNCIELFFVDMKNETTWQILVNDRGNWSSRKVCKGVSFWQQMPGCEVKVIRNKSGWEVLTAVPMNVILPNGGELRFNMVRDRHVTGKPAEYSTGSPLAMSGIWMDPKNLGTVQFEK